MELRELLYKEIMSKYKTMKDFCKELNVTQSTINSLIHRPNSSLEKAGVKLVVNMCRILKIDIYDLMDGKISAYTPYKVTASDYTMIQKINALPKEEIEEIEEIVNMKYRKIL